MILTALPTFVIVVAIPNRLTVLAGDILVIVFALGESEGANLLTPVIIDHDETIFVWRTNVEDSR